MQGKRTNTTKVMLEKLFKHGLSPLLFAIALGVGLIAVNYVIAIKAPNYDVTKNKTNTLSRQTEKLLTDIDFDITIKAFYANESQRRIKNVFDLYSKKNSHIKVEFIDPLRKPLIAEEYDVEYPRTIIFERGASTTRINPPTARGQNHGEREISIALYRLLTDETKTIYFSTGHGELNITNAKFSGISKIKTRLEEQNYIIKTINLLETGAIPDDCTLLIVPGPKVSFLDEEIAALKKYLDGEGSIMLMIDPGVETRLDNMAGSYGLKFGDDFVYETSSKLTIAQGGPTSPLCLPQTINEITKPMDNEKFMFPFVRSVNRLFEPAGYSHIPLIASSEDSWAETDMDAVRRLGTGQKPMRDENERKGPITVMTLTEREFNLPDSLATRDNYTFLVRSAFIGNSKFVTNQIVNGFSYNLDLFLNTVNWITRNERIIEVTPNAYRFTPVELRQAERRFLTWLTIVIFPVSLFIVGMIIWYRRR
ncbi:GldG family protein [Candidatus Latescibacterota bacterium]